MDNPAPSPSTHSATAQRAPVYFFFTDARDPPVSAGIFFLQPEISPVNVAVSSRLDCRRLSAPFIVPFAPTNSPPPPLHFPLVSPLNAARLPQIFSPESARPPPYLLHSGATRSPRRPILVPLNSPHSCASNEPLHSLFRAAKRRARRRLHLAGTTPSWAAATRRNYKSISTPWTPSSSPRRSEPRRPLHVRQRPRERRRRPRVCSARKHGSVAIFVNHPGRVTLSW